MSYNSTIARKKCKCQPECDKWPTMSCFGYFYAHLPESLAKKAGTRRKVAQKNKNLRHSIVLKARKEQRLINGDTALDLWFLLQMNSNEKICDNCGKSLNHYNDQDWRSSQHHVLEKSKFQSVRSNPINHLVLGMWCCHSQWHTSMLNASKMPVFSKAKEIVILLYPYLTTEEKSKISEYYLIT